MTRIAYCLLVHKNPKQVSRLIRNIYCSSDFYYVNVFGNNSTQEAWKEAFKEFESNNFLVVYKYENAWGTFQLVNVILDAMNKTASIDYDYFINLSGQCYPLKSVDVIKKTLQGNNSAYMEYLTPTIPDRNRINYAYYQSPFTTSLHNKRIPLKIPRIHKQLPGNLELYKGSMWFCLNKKHVDYILAYLKENPKLLSFFRHTLIPDELIFQTILLNSPLKDTVVNDDLRYIDWFKDNVPLPAILTVDDTYKLLKSPKLFARKFDIESDEAILDLIDSQKDNSTCLA